jgi:tRNA threonylcarbamoyladenosine biosynthesis protein TsaE
MAETRKQRAVPSPAPGALRTVFSLSEEETQELGRNLSQSFKGADLVLLEGELGMGKTVFARGLAIGLGIPGEDVSSPSFTLVQEYGGGRLPMFHVDLYRLDDAADLETLGLEELLAAGGVVVIEWGEKLPPYLSREGIRVRFHDLGEDSRRLEIVPAPPRKPRRRGDA